MGTTQEKSIYTKLISKQLSFCGKSFDETLKNPAWKTTNSITKDQFNEWLDWGVNFMVENLNLDRRKAEQEMSWFSMENSVEVKG